VGVTAVALAAGSLVSYSAGDCRGGAIARSMPATPTLLAAAFCRRSACLAGFRSGVISPYSSGLAIAGGGTSPPAIAKDRKKTGSWPVSLWWY